MWDKNTPDWFLLNWKKLKRYLLSNGDHWEVWLDWFERRVQGGTRGTAIERLFVEVPYQMRNAEPAEINAEIARRIREVEAAEPPNDTSEAQTTHYDIGDTESWPEVLKSIVSVVDYGWNDNHQIAVIAGQANLAMLNRPSRKHDHDSQRAACDKLAENLIRQLATGRYNARSEYAEALTHYRQELPDGVGSGNIHLADAQARILRDMFAAEADILNLGLATALKAFLEHHIGFRTFYAEVPAFYENVRTGVLNDPLPLDAVDNIVDIVRENTPTMFADSVAPSIAEVKDGPVAPTIAVELDPDDIRTSAQGEYPKPPADPLGEINAEMARDKATAGAVKGLWEAFLRGEKVSKNLTGWKKVYDSLAPNITDIFNSLIGNGPPPSP
ncbi:hypothetical protein CH339_14475 [Rhodobium orientis]|uniref:Uncharacterized protein n=1 Tax=Rhodobium orientis TaxID=34017 RepID=A0A327JJS1_9HYPH|nr:hypothetical protein [Rhodobium orientis]RAI26301.1 hypothetical protein CH339_14475 [Rhodobium orientis]